MLFRYVHDLRKKGASKIRTAISVALWIIPVVIFWIIGYEFIMPYMNDLLGNFLDDIFGSQNEAIQVTFLTAVLVALFVSGFKIDAKNAQNPSVARYMPGWILRLLGRTKEEVAELKSDDGFDRLRIKYQLNESMDFYLSFDGVIKGGHIDDHWDDIYMMINTRAAIHNLLQTLGESGVYIDTKSIRTVDIRWQKWARENIHERLSELDRKDQPKEYWWYWIDQLDGLSVKEKATI